MLLSFKKWNICTKNDDIINSIPISIKRRLNEISKFAIAAFYKLHINYNIPMVCASQFGSWQQIIKLAEQFYKTGEFSPAGFSKVPHNTFAGMISLLNKNQSPYTVIAAGSKTFEMGLIEAITQRNNEIIYINAEESAPEILQTNIKIDGYAFATLLSKGNGDYEFKSHTQKKIPPASVHDFIKFLNKKNDSFVTSHFTITRRQY